MEKVNRKSAPRREILRIEREGSWGRVEYAHYLDCGHVERKKRASKAPVISCAWCVVAEEEDRRLKSLARSVNHQDELDEDTLDVLGTSLAASESAIARLRADIASRFSVPVDYVDVVTADDDGSLSVSYAVLFIPAGDLPAVLAGPSSDQP